MKVGYALLIGYVASIVGANIAITVFGIVPVGFGLMAPAGVYFVGLSLLLRDLVQDSLGKRWALASVVVGSLLSTMLGANLALASFVAFLFSELADFAVYTPKRRLYAESIGCDSTDGSGDSRFARRDLPTAVAVMARAAKQRSFFGELGAT